MLHGFSGSGASWEQVVGDLSGRWRAITPDIRGHASASEQRPVELAAVLADIGDALTAAGLAPSEPFTLVGYSQGGRIALHAALDPGLGRRLRGLVLIGASPGLRDDRERAERRAADERLAAEFEELTIEQLAERWERTPILGGITAAQAARARAERLRSTPSGLAAALRGLGTGALPSLWQRLGEIAVPAVLLAGERDRKFQALNAQMARAMPHARTAVVAGTGHAVQLERPAQIAELIEQSDRA